MATAPAALQFGLSPEFETVVRGKVPAKGQRPMKLIYRCLCAVLGTLLGAGCSDNSSAPAEYGMPNGKVRLDGRVLDQAGTPIPGIGVAFGGARADTTDAAGNWAIADESILIPCVFAGAAACTVAASDLDGAANGGPFPTVEVTLNLTQTEPGSGNWDQGTWEQHGVDITMDDAAEYGPPRARRPAPGHPDR